jgi:hypothetical protein
MFSFKKGTAIARVEGGELDGKVLKITEDTDEPDRAPPPALLDLLDEDDLSRPGSRKLLKTRDRLALALALSRGDLPQDPSLLAVYENGKRKINDRMKYEISLNSGCFQMLPPNPADGGAQTERMYIAGKSGSGKSWLACFYMLEYLRIHPANKIVLFSRHEEEKTYQHIPHVAIKLDDEFAKEPIDVKVLKDCLVVFDDCDNIQDKKILTAIRRLNDDLISNGRKYGTTVLTLAHQLMDYSRTRNLLNEANRVVFFNSGSSYHIKRYLKVYAGMDTKQIEKVVAIKSRWTCISHSIPGYVLHETGAFIIRHSE